MIASALRPWTLMLALIVVSITSLAVASLKDKEEGAETATKVAIKDAPEAIQKAIRGLKDVEIEMEMVDGAAVYEVEFEADDAEVELSLTADGKLLGVEVEEEDDDDKKSDDKDDE